MTTHARFLLPLCFLFFTSCATMFGGTSDEIAINSVPPDAAVYSGEELLGRTPLFASVSRSADELTFEHPDYGRRTVALDSSFRFGALLCDILFTPGFGSSGIIIDTMTQAWWDHPENVLCDFTVPEAEKEPSAVATEESQP